MRECVVRGIECEGFESESVTWKSISDRMYRLRVIGGIKANRCHRREWWEEIVSSRCERERKEKLIRSTGVCFRTWIFAIWMMRGRGSSQGYNHSVGVIERKRERKPSTCILLVMRSRSRLESRTYNFANVILIMIMCKIVKFLEGFGRKHRAFLRRDILGRD